MKIFILDKTQKRNWSGIFQIVGVPFILKGSREAIISENIDSSDLIIAHYSDFIDGDEYFLSDLIEHFGKKGCYVLFIAGNTLDKLDNDLFPRYYRRYNSVTPNGIDKQFATCLIDLVHHLSFSPESPDWSLIEPPPFPEYLLSAYILQCAVKKGLDKDKLCMDDEFWSNALEEFKDQQSQIFDEADTPTKLSLDTGYENVRQVFTKITRGHIS